MMTRVALSKAAKRTLKSCPKHILVKLLGWVELVENEGLQTARKIPGYHDEPLRGSRKGQRSIRLSRTWRAIYVIIELAGQGSVTFVNVMEVSKHDY